MKKILLFVVVALFSAATFADTYSLGGISSSNSTLSNGTWGTYKMDEVDVPSVNAEAGQALTLAVTNTPITFSYTNSSAKSNILKCAADYLQTDGKGVSLTISNVTVGDVISIEVSAKGSTNAVFEVTSGATADSSNSASIAKAADLDSYTTLKFTATATTVVIKETAGGYRIQTATIGEATEPIKPTEPTEPTEPTDPVEPNSNVIYNGEDWAYEQSGTEVAGPTVALAKVNATLTVNGSDAQFTTIEGGVEASVTFNDRFFGSFLNSNDNKKFVKIAKNGNIQYEGKDFIFNISGLKAGDKVVFTDNGGATGAGFFQDGADTTADPTHTLAEQNGTVTFTATGSTLTVKTNGTKARISKIEVIEGSSSIQNPTIADAIYFNGAEIINQQGLTLQVYNTLGRLVRTSNSDINMSDLKGIYIVRAEGLSGALKINR